MPEKIKIIFLGTSDAIPTVKRNHTSILFNYKNENILVDCGEGTQRQFKKAGLNPCKLTKILITHWHGDHILGLPGLLQTLAFNGYNRSLFIYGPKGTKKLMRNLLKTFIFVGKLNLKVEEIREGRFFENEDFYLEAKKMEHGALCLAYSFVKKGKIKIDKEKLKKVKLPEGPWLNKLKQGKDIVYKEKKYKVKDLTYKEKDKKISFVLDTSINSRIVNFVKGSDLLICEATFSHDLKDKAKKYGHLTASQAAEIAKKSKTKKLFLTHLSQRYEKNPKKLLNEAKKIFKNCFLAKDLDSIILE